MTKKTEEEDIEEHGAKVAAEGAEIWIEIDEDLTTEARRGGVDGETRMTEEAAGGKEETGIEAANGTTGIVRDETEIATGKREGTASATGKRTETATETERRIRTVIETGTRTGIVSETETETETGTVTEEGTATDQTGEIVVAAKGTTEESDIEEGRGILLATRTLRSRRRRNLRVCEL